MSRVISYLLAKLPFLTFTMQLSDDGDDEHFVYPAPSSSNIREATPPRQIHPTPAQLESLYAAASSGDLTLLKRLFKSATETGDVQPFSLANDASSRTGFTALHASASRGYRVLVVDDCGAMPDLEDREGETALHKAALHGHISIVSYLLPGKADVHAQDADGWTALHNACSKGYLDIVMWLCENGGAASTKNGVSGVDVRSNDGWTPLMNASSKGHLPVVLYLLTKQSANPLVRNKWGETAYDVAAAVFEVWICEVLQQAESKRWHASPTPYNPLLVHTTLPLLLYENQRLDTRGRPKFSASGLGRHGRRPPFELKLPKPDDDTGAQEIAAWRSGVQLPAREAPWVLPKPEAVTENVERSHFWLSDWILDISHFAVDPQEGWQYAQSFGESDECWVAEKPPHLERMLHGNGGSTSKRSASLSSSSPGRVTHTWVRRRRWVRIMRRRLDIPPLPFLEPDGAMYHLEADGSLIPFIEETQNDPSDGQELGTMASTFLSSAQDYVARARYLVEKHSQDLDSNAALTSAVETRRAIANLERSTTELRQGILGDDDSERKIQAEVLLNAYSRELERRRLSAGALGLLAEHDDEQFDSGDNSSDEEFHYPTSPPSREMARLSSTSFASTDHFTRPGTSRVPADLTPQLSQAPDFRVPTREAPQKVISHQWISPSPHGSNAQWERDESVKQCRECQRRFNFILRRHHCRKCGRIFCDRCSSHWASLDPSDIVYDPTSPDVPASATPQRLCQGCFDEVNADRPDKLRDGGTSMECVIVDQERLTIPGRLTTMQRSSQLSDLADCPVCNQNLDDVGGSSKQEIHVKRCLEGESGSTPQAAKYFVYCLPAASPLIGIQCVICLGGEFVKGTSVGRLSCFCSFHSACLSCWLQRGKDCPVHAR